MSIKEILLTSDGRPRDKAAILEEIRLVLLGCIQEMTGSLIVDNIIRERKGMPDFEKCETLKNAEILLARLEE
jgi:hypothetical protein